MKKMNFKKVVATVMAILTVGTLSVALSGCDKEEAVNQNTTYPTGVASNTEEKIDMVTVETPYGDLQYPASHKDKMIVKSKEEDGYYLVEFKTKASGTTLKLFDVQFGDGSGDYQGTVKKGEEEVDVYVNFNDDFEPSDYNDKEITTIYAMLEDINYVIDSIENIESFKK